MFLSRAGEHAIRATLFVASSAEEMPLLVRDIARALDIPSASLAKTVQTLTRHGVLTSQKGPGGGVRLAAGAEEISLLDVARRVEGRDVTRECLIGIPGCSDQGPHCPLHDRWQRIRARAQVLLATRTIGDVAGQLRGKRYVLSRRSASELPGGIIEDLVVARRATSKRRGAP